MIDELREGIAFLSMPYSSKLETEDEQIAEKNERFEKSLKLLSFLQLNRVHVLSPITQGHPVVSKYDVPSDWKYWEDYCYKLISVSTSIIVFKIKGWDISSGVAGEIQHAKNFSKKIYFIDEDFNIEKLN